MNYLRVSKIAQLILAGFIMLLVLIQSKGLGLSNSLSGVGGFYRTRRGIEKLVFILTIFFGALFVVNSVLIVYLS